MPGLQSTNPTQIRERPRATIKKANPLSIKTVSWVVSSETGRSRQKTLS